MTDINIPDIYDLNDLNDSQHQHQYKNIIERIKIEIINGRINIFICSDKFYKKFINPSEDKNIINLEDIFISINYGYSYFANLFFTIDNYKNKHILTRKTNYEQIELEIFDNLLYNDIYPTDCKLKLDTNNDDTIIIFISDLKYHIAPYKFSTYFSDRITLKKYCKYITIDISDLDYDYNCINQNIIIKQNNSIIEFKCIIRYNRLNILFISINNNYTSNIVNKNCSACNKINDYSKFNNITQKIKDKLKNNLIKNIVDCNTHYFNDDDLFKNIFINIKIYEILEKLNIYTSQKKFIIRYNYCH